VSVFYSGSIRGKYNEEWNRETAYRIGYHLAGLLDLKTVVIGRDGRLSSREIRDALSEGLMRAGCAVTDIGMIDTPGLCFANIACGFDGSVMITASHNPPAFNGMKISGRKGLVISRKNGLAELEKLVEQEPGETVPGGSLNTLDIRPEYLKKILPYKEGIGRIKCVVDCSNGMASRMIHSILAEIPGTYQVFNNNIDGNFPGHGPNPTIESNLQDLKEHVVSSGADVGICFDGDGDRTIVVDEKGRWISPDLILAFLGLYYFKHFPGRRNGADGVLYDARSTNTIPDFIESLGGKAYICSTGHRAMQVGLTEKNGIMGGELPGHYYYRDFYNLDNGWIPFLQVLAVLSLEKQPLSELIDRISRYCFSGEINFTVSDGDSVIRHLEEKFHDGRKTRLDGVRIDYEEWWFLVRMANTEPVLRLVVEGKTPAILKEKTELVSGDIRRLGGREHGL